MSFRLDKICICDVMDNIYNNKNSSIKKEDNLALKIFNDYCEKYCYNIQLMQVNQELFKKFILYYLPKQYMCLAQKNTKTILLEIYSFLENIKTNYNFDVTNFFEINYNKYIEDTVRIMNLRKEMQRCIKSPVISWNPLVIDFNYYKQNNTLNKKNWFIKRECIEQGYYETVDVLNNNVYLFRKLHVPYSIIKIKFEKNNIKLLKNSDIIHMKIKRKMFSKIWDIVEIKGCYLNKENYYF